MQFQEKSQKNPNILRQFIMLKELTLTIMPQQYLLRKIAYGFYGKVFHQTMPTAFPAKTKITGTWHQDQLKFSYFLDQLQLPTTAGQSQKVYRQIICRQSRSTTMVTEVKLHYFCGRCSTMVVAVKKFSSIFERIWQF